MSGLLYKDEFRISDSVSIVIPKVGEIIEDESYYYDLVSIFTAMPIDMICQLEDAGIDFTEIDEFDLFLRMFNRLKEMDVSLLLKGVDFSKFEMAINSVNEKIVLLDRENDIAIDELIHSQIADALRRIHRIEKNDKKPANSAAKAFMIKRARTRYNREKNKEKKSFLEPLIVAMVNTEQYKYNFEETKNLSIYQFRESLHQVVKKVEYDNKMYGVYSGTIKAEDLSQSDLNWLVHKQ